MVNSMWKDRLQNIVNDRFADGEFIKKMDERNTLEEN